MVPFQKVLWAVDPFNGRARFKVPLKALKYLVETGQSFVQPVYVVPPRKRSEEQPRAHALDQKVISAFVNEVYLRHILPPQVVQAASTRPNSITDALLAYGAQVGADLILVSPGKEPFLRRNFPVNFVNRLLLRSSIPVMALGPEVRDVRPFDRILYATHLDPRSEKDFKQAVIIAETFQSELNVLHLLTRRQRDQEGGNSTAVGQPLPETSPLMIRSRAWAKWASRKGVPIETTFEDSLKQVEEQILQAAERHQVGLILLESRSRSWSAFLKGSKVREVIRRAHCPVWVQRVPGSHEGQVSSFEIDNRAA